MTLRHHTGVGLFVAMLAGGCAAPPGATPSAETKPAAGPAQRTGEDRPDRWEVRRTSPPAASGGLAADQLAAQVSSYAKATDATALGRTPTPAGSAVNFSTPATPPPAGSPIAATPPLTVVPPPDARRGTGGRRPEGGGAPVGRRQRAAELRAARGAGVGRYRPVGRPPGRPRPARPGDRQAVAGQPPRPGRPTRLPAVRHARRRRVGRRVGPAATGVDQRPAAGRPRRPGRRRQRVRQPAVGAAGQPEPDPHPVDPPAGADGGPNCGPRPTWPSRRRCCASR